MSKLEIAIGEKAFSFTDWQDWLNNAQEMFYANELNRHNSICIDAAGRICLKGAEFQRARQENSFPVDVYRI